MTLDDAIVAFRQVASDDFDSLELDVRDYERLVMWLTELKLARESAFSDIGLAARATSENHQLKAENAKLRQHLADVTVSIGRVEERCAKLRELLDYVTPIAWYAASERERDRMRKLGVEVTS